jgi:hypothetical protein
MIHRSLAILDLVKFTEQKNRRLKLEKPRPYHCSESGCQVRPFSNKHDLSRHLREVHHKDSDGRASREYYCPLTHCKRHRQGFARRWNLVQHCDKVHGSNIKDFRQIDGNSEITSPSDNSGSDKRELRNKLKTELMEAESERTKALQDLEEKAKRIEAEKASLIQKYDDKIGALRNLIHVLDEGI